MENKKMIWDLIGYGTLAMCIIGQITVGYWYLLAQCVYLVANVLSVVRSVKCGLPTPNVVKDVCFTAITSGLIIIYLIK